MSHYSLSGHLTVEVTQSYDQSYLDEDALPGELSRSLNADGTVTVITEEIIQASEFGLEESRPEEPGPDDHIQELHVAFLDGYQIALEIGSNNDGFTIEPTDVIAAKITDDQSFFWR